MLALNSTMGLSACGWLFAINLPQYKISANMRQTIVIRSTPRVQNLNINLSSGLVEVVSSRSLATRMNVIKQISNHLVEINALKASQHILINGKFEIHWRAYRFRSFFDSFSFSTDGAYWVFAVSKRKSILKLKHCVICHRYQTRYLVDIKIEYFECCKILHFIFWHQTDRN